MNEKYRGYCMIYIIRIYSTINVLHIPEARLSWRSKCQNYQNSGTFRMIGIYHQSDTGSDKNKHVHSPIQQIHRRS